MQVIVCVDDDLGMMFNHRRVSKDRKLIDRMLEITKGKRILMNHYSEELFAGKQDIFVEDDFLEKAGDQDVCFVENEPLAPYTDQINKIILYRWNRKYPADVHFDISLNGWQLVESYDFKGYSHEKITEEVYER